MIRVGDLVEIQRPSILVAKGTVALVMEIFAPTVNRRVPIAAVLPVGTDQRRKYVDSDLKVISSAYNYL